MREGDHVLQSNTEVKNAWSYISTSPYVFMVRYLVKHRDKLSYSLQYVRIISAVTKLEVQYIRGESQMSNKQKR